MPIIIIVIPVLFHDFETEVADSHRTILAEPPRTDDVGGATATEDLAADTAVVLSPPCSEDLHRSVPFRVSADSTTDRLAIIALLTMLIRHPIMLAQSLSSYPPNDPTDTVRLFDHPQTPHAPRIILPEREAGDIRHVLIQLRIVYHG